MYQYDKFMDDLLAMDIYEIRLQNVRDLAKLLGSQAKLADKLNKSESQISQIIGRNPTRTIGYEQAREIEETLGLPSGEIDLDPALIHARYPQTVQDVADTLAGLPVEFQQRILELVRSYPTP